LGFIAPTVTLLFPIFFKGIAIIKDKLLIQEEQFERLTKMESEKIDESLKDAEMMMGPDIQKMKERFKKKRAKQQHNVINELRRSLYYFELKSQIKWIFIPLFISLVYVMLYSVVKCNIFNRFDTDTVKSIGENIVLFHSIIFLLTCAWIFFRVRIDKFKEKLSSWEIAINDRWLGITIGALILSLLTYFCIYNNWLNFTVKNLKICIELYMLLISLFMFVFTVRRLWRIVSTVIEAKPMLEEQDKPSFSVPTLSPMSPVPPIKQK
jgi:hypothetical protein